MRIKTVGAFGYIGVVLGTALLAGGCGDSKKTEPWNIPARIDEGREVFRNDTFGDEQFWTGMLMMNEVIQTAVDPTTALSVGLKVDAEALPAGILMTADLKSPATTVALLKLNAVVGVKGTVVTEGGVDRLMSVGITCALCHSNVDDSVMPGIGRRMDGWPNTQLNPGAIIALSPALTAEQKAVYMSWGPGKYDPRYNADGMNGPVVIPPAYGLRDAPHATFTGDGDIRYWNRYVAVTQMGGQGTFKDARVGVDKSAPAGTTDMVGPKLEALRSYQFSLDPPAPPAGSFDSAAADRGLTTFNQKCGSCHQGNRGRSDDQLHDPAETGVDPTYAMRSASKKYRATPLRGLWQHAPYFHDGSAATLPAVVDHYNTHLQLSLTDAQKTDLVEYLKSI